ncbi:MAG: hypothetical protein OD815_000397 [Candidatus Alkanophagales archaeon MCA70_species_2]|nr:hypothetical protein [Candidatus Alkanophaga liquidiphilum]
MVVGTWVMAGGTCAMAYFIGKQYKQTQRQFKHMRKQSEKPAILDLIRYVIAPFLREIEEMPRDVWPSFKPLGEPSEWDDSDRAKLAFDQFKEKFPDAWRKVEEYDNLGKRYAEALEPLEEDMVKTLLSEHRAKLEEYAQRRDWSDIEKLAQNIAKHSYELIAKHSYELRRGRRDYSFYKENPDVADSLRENFLAEMDKVERRRKQLEDAGRKLKKEFESIQKKLWSEYDIRADDYSPRLKRPAVKFM